MVVGIMLYTNQPKIYKLPQALLAGEMWRQGCSQAVIRCLHRIVICQDVKTTRGVVDRLGKDFDHEIQDWKTAIEVIIMLLANANHTEDFKFLLLKRSVCFIAFKLLFLSSNLCN